MAYDILDPLMPKYPNVYDTFNKLKTKNVSSLQKEFIKDTQKTTFDLIDLYEYISQIAKFRFEMHDFMDNYDIILCPPCATPAKLHNTSFSNIEDYTYAMTYNLLGWPAGVVRCGQTKEGLPIGVQIVAKPFYDHVVMDILHKLEQEFGGFCPPDFKNLMQTNSHDSTKTL
jgi:amidase